MAEGLVPTRETAVAVGGNEAAGLLELAVLVASICTVDTRTAFHQHNVHAMYCAKTSLSKPDN